MERSEELRDFVLLYCQAIASGDLGFVERHMSRQDELLVIGTDPREWWAGYATAIKAYATGIAETASGMALIGGDPQAWREGSVGWAADRVKIRLSDGTEIPCRLTMVWHQENGRWKIVQHHLSIGIGSDEAAGRP